MASADFWRPIGAALAAPSTWQASRSPRVRRATFSPHTRRIYAGAIRMTSDFGSSCPLVHRVDASYALRVPRAGDLPRASFRLRLAADALALRLVVPVITVHRGLSPPSRFPARFPSPVAVTRAPALALRAMPGAQKESPPRGEGGSGYCSLVPGRRQLPPWPPWGAGAAAPSGLISSSSMSKISVALGGMLPPAPRSP